MFLDRTMKQNRKSDDMKFYDTNVLLHDKNWTKEEFLISSVTIEELESIKLSEEKNQKIRYLARKASRWLIDNPNQYEVFLFDQNDKIIKKKFPFTIDSQDKKILATAVMAKERGYLFDFVTSDFNCYLFAQAIGLNAQLLKEECKKNKYNGYRTITCPSDETLADFYTNINDPTFWEYEDENDLKINEYLLVYDKDNNLIDKYRYLGKGKFEQVKFVAAESKMFGKVKPIDPYQELVLDSFKHNQLTLVKGPAGTGKSLLSLAYLFRAMEKGDIDKIIIFCNTVATAGSAKLGYYPGDRTEKLLDSQIGNFLISKIGAREGVEKLIDMGQLLLLPMSDIRGFDTSGMKAGIYITEAQNLNVELMKLALQRIGEDSICILDGDNETQVDLNTYAGDNNGLKRVSEVFRGQPFYGEITLKTIHRSKIANIASRM